MKNFTRAFLVLLVSFVSHVYLSAVCTESSDVDGNALLLPDEKNCSRFYICDENIAFLHNCSEGLVYHPKLKVCARLGTVRDDVLVDYCEWVDDVYLKPHFCDCTKYVICTYGKAEEGACGVGEYFNSLKGEARIPLRSANDTLLLNSSVCWQGKCVD